MLGIRVTEKIFFVCNNDRTMDKLIYINYKAIIRKINPVKLFNYNWRLNKDKTLSMAVRKT